MDATTYCAAVTCHYERNWPRQYSVKRHSHGPIHELPATFRVLEFASTTERDMWAYATACMSLPEDERKLELHLFSPVQSGGHVELLTAIAHYHRTGATLALGHTVNFGRPWLPGSSCSYGLISLPYLDGPLLENLQLPNSKEIVKCLWLLPITASEVEFKKRHGVERLEEIFESASINYLDPDRKSMA